MPTFVISDAAVAWLRNGERGISSEAIFAHLTGLPVGDSYRPLGYPSDPDDLRRCWLLLREVPEFAPRIWEMATASPQWAALVRVWDRLIATLEAEMTGTSGKAPRTYALMREVLEATYAAAQPPKVGP